MFQPDLWIEGKIIGNINNFLKSAAIGFLKKHTPSKKNNFPFL